MEKIKLLSYVQIEGSYKEKVDAYSTILGWNCTADYHNEDPERFYRTGESRGLNREKWLASCRYNDMERSKKGVEKLLNAIVAKDKVFLESILFTGNKNFRKIFEVETGVLLGKTDKSMKAALKGWDNI